MKTFAAGAGFVLILLMAQVVGAGVFMVLGPLALEIQDEELQIVALGVVGAAAIVAALAFMSGSLRAVVASLQSQPRQRGG